MPTGYDDILFYIKDGLKTSEGVDLIFYETINSGFTAKMKEFETNFFKNNIGFFDGWMAERWEDIYNTTLRHKRERCVPFDMAFTFAIREYFFMSVYWDLFTHVMPSNIVDRNSRNLIRLFFNNIDLFKLFVARRLCEDNITMLEYHKALCAEREDKPECPTCMCLIDYPFKNDHGIVPVQNKNLLNPVLLSGAMYYPIPGDDILSFFISSLYGSLCGLEEMRNPLRMVTVIFLSMGLLNIFTLFVSFFFIFLYYIFCFKLYVISPNVYQYFYESIYTFVLDIVCDQAGLLAVVHFPLVFSVFNVILCGNIIGLIPFGFTITSHLTFTFSFGLFIFTGIILLTVLNKRYDFFRLFIPTGVPKALVPLLCVIEVISYVFRVISLSVRLFANMMAGHALLHILLGFVPIIMGFKNVTRFVFVFPIAIIVLITILEIGISILQSYVFIVLISIYLRDCYGVAGH
jgi:ATP synthase subunit 6